MSPLDVFSSVALRLMELLLKRFDNSASRAGDRNARECLLHWNLF